MNVTLRHLRAAVAVATTGSFRRAAETVHLSQPALSLAISELEGELGVRLFDRTSRSVAITELGESFVQGARGVLADFDRLVQEVGEVAQSRRGRVVVSCVSSIAGRVMPLALERCAERYPQVDVTVHDDVAMGVLNTVRSREADFGLTIEPAELGEGMAFEPLQQDRFHVVFPREHALARKKRVAWRDLNGIRFIALSTTSGTHQMIRGEMVRQGVVLGSSTPVSHLSTVHGMLEAGFGVSVLPVIALPVAGHPTLTSRPLVNPPLSRTIGVYSRRDRSFSPAASAFVEVVRSVLRELAASRPKAGSLQV
ncbi:LysR family transcriptional regulator [Caenimonas sp. SL110]|uniref:LysR family transcriptional regulator n=1 Tax=Caenimonas sp. SL110 TaxID=1450524 RepID=UPI000653A65F|nr:LysR family transcriptional regulator [Caenimonas sp. SL110]